MEKVPLEKRDDEVEGEAEDSRRDDEREEIVGLQLLRRVDDGVTEAASSHAAGAGEELSGDGSDDGDAGGDADADEERGDGVAAAAA